MKERQTNQIKKKTLKKKIRPSKPEEIPSQTREEVTEISDFGHVKIPTGVSELIVMSDEIESRQEGSKN